MKSAKDVLKAIKDNDVKYVDFRFTDPRGKWQHVTFDVGMIDEDIFAEGEVDRFYINFCDPWPKKRHAKRRLTHVGFLEKYRRLLKKPGELHFKTDNRPLFDFSLEQFEEAGLRVQDVSYDLHAENRPDNIMTEYERKFSGFGEKINRCEVIFE